MSGVHGIHHVTVIAGDPQENLDFYTGVLGMRLVKRSVNQDDPGTYHLFYADGAGTPGTDLTFFPWPGQPPARPGAGQIVEVPLAVPAGSLAFWQARLEEHAISTGDEEERFGERALPFEDPHGLSLALIETDDQRPFEPWADSSVPADRQVRGMHTVRMWETDRDRTAALLVETLGFRLVAEDGEWQRYASAGGGSGTYADLRATPEARRAGGGVGGVHHVAWRTPDVDAELVLREAVAARGLRPTPLIDRFWFQSVYFREPGGVLFELATDGPGFGVDEDPEHLGEALVLPPWLEERRDEIEAALPRLED